MKKLSFPGRKLFSFIFFFLSISALFASSSNPIFIPNNGQWNGPFSYKSQFGNMTVFSENTGFTFLLSEEIPHDHEGHDHSGEMISKHAFSLKFLGANDMVFEGSDQKSGIHNYFYGKDQSKWVRNVPLFASITSSEIYPGINIQAYGEGNSFKYDFIIQPGADHQQIELQYSGIDELNFRPESLTLVTSLGDLVESIPISYQIINGEKVSVYCEYLQTENGIGFLFPYGYDTSLPLIIDPILVASTLSGTGSGGSNFGHGASYDLAGNIYTHAISFDSAYPTDEGSFQEVYGGGGTDAAISKLTPDGSDLIYATFLGGAGSEHPISTIVNGNEEIYVFGITSSNDYPVALDAFQPDLGGGDDIFLTALSADGSDIVGSTYLGGSNGDGRNIVGFGYDNYRGEINVNLNGEVFLASCSSSDNFPVTSGVLQESKKDGQDGVVLKMNSDLSEMIWSTFIGSDVDDMAYGIRIKDDQSIYVSGAVGGSSNGGNGDGFITTAGAYQETFTGGENDGFITHITSDASSILESTFIGETGSDKCYFMDLDNLDNVWVYMQTQSNWTVTDDAYGTGTGNLVVHKLTEDLSQLLVTSYLTPNSSGNGTPVAFMVDLCNNVYASSYGTGGSDFDASEDALFQNGGFYVGVFTPDMSDLEYGTYYTESHVDGGTSRFDKQGIVYQGVCSGGGFNTTVDAWATTQATGWDIGVFKIDFEIQSVNAVAGAAGYLTGCAPHTVIFQNFSTGESFEWDFDDGNTSDEYEPVIVYEEPGDYLVELVVFDSLSCNLSDTVLIPITVLPEVEFFTGFTYTVDCQTGEVQITDESQGPADIEYEWDMGDGTILSDENPTHIYEEPGEYTVTLTLTSEACNQEMIEEQVVVYIPFIEADFGVQVLDICDSFLIGVFNQSSGGINYTWDMGDGTVLSVTENFEHTYESSGTYTIQLIIENEFSCNLGDTITQEIELIDPPVLDPEISMTQTGLCEDLIGLASVNPNGPASTYAWFINEELTGTESTLNTIVSEPGVYNVQVIVTDPICEAEFIEEIQFTFYENLGFLLLPSDFLCYYEESLFLDATVPFEDATYSWNGGIWTDPILEVTEGGNYEVIVNFNGCDEIQETSVSAVQEFPLAFEELICQDQPNTVVFQDDFGFIEEVFWDNGQVGFEVEVSEPGFYPFTAVDMFGCDQVDSLLAVARDDDPNLEIPNIFTPNGDGFNDVFQIQGDDLVYFELQIFDRWGKLVHETTEIYSSWDGKYTAGSGSESGDDTFMFILKYRDLCDLETNVETGNIKVLR